MVKTITVLAYLLRSMHPNHLPFEVHSSAIDHHHVKSAYTCRGGNRLMPITWRGIPKGTQSLVMMMYDIDAPNGTWYNWVVYNIPPKLHYLNDLDINSLPIAEGINSWGHFHYDGPCAQQGMHRYVIHLYALNKKLHLTRHEIATVPVVMAHMRGHVIADTDTVGFADSKS